MAFSVMIVEDHPIVRDGLRSLFGSDGDFSSVRLASCGEELLLLCRRHGAPDIVVSDVRMPGMNGFETWDRLKRAFGNIKCLFIAGLPLKSEEERARASGASGYLPKSITGERLKAAVLDIANGRGGFICEEVASGDAVDVLTARETVVLRKLAQGLTREEIATSEGVGVETVKSQVRSILLKLDVANSVAAVATAYRRGILHTILAFAAAGFAWGGPADHERNARRLVAEMTSDEKASQLVRDAAAIPRLGVPACNWWNEGLHGVARSGLATVFPQAIGLGATFDEGLLEDVGRIVGTETRAKYNLYRRKGVTGRYAGLTLWSPNVNMFRDPRWGRGQETYGEDPFLSGKLGAAFVRGVQGNHPVYHLASACAKHFAVHSGPEKGRRGFNAKVSERDLREYYLPAFKMLIDEGRVSCVMTAYNAVNGVPATACRRLLTDILRGEWGFGGFVVSDVGAVDGLVRGHRFAAAPASAVSSALCAGLDIGGDRNVEAAQEAVRQGLVPPGTLDDCLVRTFTERFRLGTAGPGDPTPWAHLGAGDVATSEHRARALDAAEKSIVLVSNRGSCLPLDPSGIRRLGVAGPRAFDEVALYANYNGFSDVPSTAFSGFVGEGGPGLLVMDGEFATPDTTCDAVVACIGLNAKSEGEEGTFGGDGSGDRLTIDMPSEQIDELRRLRSVTKRLIGVVFGGSPLNLRPAVELCDAVLLAWYPGETGGRAIARTVFGRSNPAGRLPVTFPERAEDLPPMTSYSLVGRTYRYATKKPLYPFGYGLSYTTFDYSALGLEKKEKCVMATVTVSNRGERAGDEVVQLYVRAPSESGDRRVHHLEAFRRVRIAAGCSTTITFDIPRSAFEVFGDDGVPFVPHGDSTVFVGGGQPGYAATLSASVSW